MKSVLFALVLFSVSVAWSKQVPIDTTKSSLEWLGQKKVPGGDHKGTVKIKKGMVNMDKKSMLTGGTLVIDMTTIEDTDLSGKYKKKLEDHLNSEDFFHVKKHPEATFKITKVEPTRSDVFKVTGNLTLRGNTHAETFDVQVKKKGKIWMASGDIEFDRTKYGVTYNSETSLLKKAVKLAKDKIIKDKIKLTLNLQTQAG